MKYIRKAIALVLIAVFIAAVAIGLSVIFAVRNVNVCTVDYATGSDCDGTDEFSEAVASVKAGLSDFEGKTITSVRDDDIAAVVNASGYAEFVSAERIYPCTINVTVRERVEVFAVPADDGSYYTMLDGNCSAISTKQSNANNIDGSPNVVLSGVPAEDYTLVTSLCNTMAQKYLSVRAFAESISVTSDAMLGESLLIKLRCGVTMEIREYKERAEEKAERLFSAFDSMADYLKLGGTIYCMDTESGALRVVLPDGTVE